MIQQQSTTTTTTCVICGATDIPTEGKYLHMCIVRKGRKVLSREWIGWYDGRPITYSSDYNVAYADLNSQVYDILQSDAVITADAIAEQAAELSTEAPLWACKACGGEHFIQNCPAIRALLLAPEERVAPFAAPVAEGWGCDGWSEVAA